MTILFHLDKVYWAAGHRAGALFFARHLDNFILTRNFSAVYRDWCHLDKLP